MYKRQHPNDGGGGNNTVIVGAGVTSKLLTNLTPGKQYQLRFRHNCDQGILSDWKSRAFITPASRLSTENEIYIFPNPFSGQLFLQFPTDFNGDAEVAVFDVLGNEVLRSALPDLTSKALVQIDGLEDWASDVYFVRLEHEGKFWSWKVVK